MSLRSMNTLHVLHPEEQAEHYLKPPCPICQCEYTFADNRFPGSQKLAPSWLFTNLIKMESRRIDLHLSHSLWGL